MKIPNKIKIGSSLYDIKKKHFFTSNPQQLGKIDYYDRKMYIKILPDKRRTEQIFFHEIAHGLLKELEFNYPQLSCFKNNERFTQELGLMLRNLFVELNRVEIKGE